MKKSLLPSIFALAMIVTTTHAWGELPSAAWKWYGSGGTDTGTTLDSGEKVYTVLNKYIDMDTNGVTVPANGFTFSFWTKRAGSNWRNYAGFSDTTAGLMIQQNATAGTMNIYGSGAMNNQAGDQKFNLAADPLQLVTFVSKEGTLYTYVNGELNNTFTPNATTWPSFSQNGQMRYFALGAAPSTSGGNAGNGGCTTYIADARVYAQAFTAEQVKELYDDYATRAAAKKTYTRTVTAAADWSADAAWTDQNETTAAAPGTNDDVTLTVNADSTITMNAAATVGALTIGGSAKATFDGDNSLTAASTAVNTDTDVSGITANLGATTIVSDKTLSIGANTSLSVANGANSGTIHVTGGTTDAPIVLNCGTAANDYIGAVTVAADTYLRLHATGGNKTYNITGNGETSHVILTSGQGWGVSDNNNSKIQNCTLEISGDNNFWLTPSKIGENVHLVLNRQLTFENDNNAGTLNIVSLSGEGAIVANGSHTINITDGAGAVYTGAISGSHSLMKSGTGVQTLSGANTYSGTTTVSGGALKLVDAATLGSGAVTVNGNLIYNRNDATTPANTFTGAGTITADACTLDLTSANISEYTGGYSVVNNGVLILNAGDEGSLADDGVTVESNVTVDGGTLRLVLSVEQLATTYTAKVPEGVTVEFYDGDTKLDTDTGANGNTYTSPTPSWKPVGAESTFDTDGCWSNGEVPTEGAIVIDTSAYEADIAVVVSRYYSSISVVGNSEYITSVSFAEGVSADSAISVAGLVEFPYDLVMGNTEAFTVDDDAGFLVVDSGTGEVTSGVNVAGFWNFAKKGLGTLTLSARLNGGKKIRVLEGTLKFTNANGDYAAKITIDEGAVLSVVNNDAHYNPVSRSGTIVNNGTFSYSSTHTTENCHLWATMSGTGKVVIEKGAYKFNLANIYTGGTEVRDGAKLLVDNAAAIPENSLTGAGTVQIDGVASNPTYCLVSENWTGLVRVGYALGNQPDYSRFGREGSTIEIMSTASANFFKQADQISANLVINGTISQNNGWSTGGGAVLSGTITGTGTLQTSGTPTDVIQIIGDASGFAGTITVAGGHCISFGEHTNIDDDNGKLLVKSGKVANVASGKIWSAVNGVVVDGVLGGAGTVSSALTFNVGATLDVSSGAPLTVTGTLTLPTDGRVTVNLPDNPEVGMEILKYSSELTVNISKLKAGRYTLLTETADGVTTVKLGPMTGFLIRVR